jgi:hypothetical protein
MVDSADRDDELRRAVDAGIPLITDLQRAQAIIEALRHRKLPRFCQKRIVR